MAKKLKRKMSQKRKRKQKEGIFGMQRFITKMRKDLEAKGTPIPPGVTDQEIKRMIQEFREGEHDG